VAFSAIWVRDIGLPVSTSRSIGLGLRRWQRFDEFLQFATNLSERLAKSSDKTDRKVSAIILFARKS